MTLKEALAKIFNYKNPNNANSTAPVLGMDKSMSFGVGQNLSFKQSQQAQNTAKKEPAVPVGKAEVNKPGTAVGRTASAVGRFGVGIGQQILKTGVEATALTTTDAIRQILSYNQETGKNRMASEFSYKVPQPVAGVSKMLLGTDELKSTLGRIQSAAGVGQKVSEAVSPFKQLGIDTNLTNKLDRVSGQFGGGLFMGLMAASDLTGFGGAKKKVGQEIAEQSGRKLVPIAKDFLQSSAVKLGLGTKEISNLVNTITRSSSARKILFNLDRLGYQADYDVANKLANTRDVKKVTAIMDNLPLIPKDPSDLPILQQLRDIYGDKGKEYISDNLMSARANRLIAQGKVTLNKLLSGNIPNKPESAVAGSRILSTISTKARDLAIEASTNPTNEAIAAADNAAQEVRQAFLAVQKVASNAGRNLRTFGVNWGGTSATEINMQKIISQMEKKIGESLSPEQLRHLAAMGDDTLAISKYLSQIDSATTGEKLHFIWINSLVSNPLSQVKNIVSNTANLLYLPIRREVAGRLSSDIARGEGAAMLRGYAGSILDASKAFLQTMKTGLSSEAASKIEVSQDAIKGTLGKSIGLPTRLLSSADEFFKTIASRGELNAQALRYAKREGLKGDALVTRVKQILDNPLGELGQKEFNKIMSAMRNTALEATWQQNPGELANTIMKARRIPGVGPLFITPLVPFVRTPANIFNQSIRMSPLGFIQYAIKKSIDKGFTGEQAAKELADTVIGSMIMSSFINKDIRDRISGGAPSDQNDRIEWQKGDPGKLDYSIKVGDDWVSYKGIEPVASILGMAADFSKALEEGKSDKALIDRMFDGFARTGKLFLDKSYTSTLSDMIEALSSSNGGAKAEKLGARMIGGTIPYSGLMKSIVDVIDPNYRNPKGFYDNIKSKLPYFSGKVSPRLNQWGEPIIKPGSGVSRVLSPIQVSESVDSPIDLELNRLGTIVGYPSPSITIPETDAKLMGIPEDKRILKLNQKQYTYLSWVSGQTTKQNLEKIMSTQEYQLMSDEEKISAIESISSQAREYGRTLTIINILKGTLK